MLVTDEFRFGSRFTKFPGGGLEFGEGPADCVKREFIEELNQPVKITGHFYTTDYFQVSAFNPSHQLISIYYLLQLEGEQEFKCVKEAFDFTELTEGAQCFRWVALSDIDEAMFHFPVDKKVAKMLRKQ